MRKLSQEQAVLHQAAEHRVGRSNNSKAVKIALVAAILGAVLFAMNCHTTVVYFNAKQKPTGKAVRGQENGKYEKIYTQRYVTFNLTRKEISKPRTIKCNVNLAFVHIEQTFMDAMIHFFAGPFYSPKTISVYCLKNKPAPRTAAEKTAAKEIARIQKEREDEEKREREKGSEKEK